MFPAVYVYGLGRDHPCIVILTAVVSLLYIKCCGLLSMLSCPVGTAFMKLLVTVCSLRLEVAEFPPSSYERPELLLPKGFFERLGP